jgi:hypothetical protein
MRKHHLNGEEESEVAVKKEVEGETSIEQEENEEDVWIKQEEDEEDMWIKQEEVEESETNSTSSDLTTTLSGLSISSQPKFNPDFTLCRLPLPGFISYE